MACNITFAPKTEHYSQTTMIAQDSSYDCLVKIFKLLNVDDLVRCSRVCMSWHIATHNDELYFNLAAQFQFFQKEAKDFKGQSRALFINQIIYNCPQLSGMTLTQSLNAFFVTKCMYTLDQLGYWLSQCGGDYLDKVIKNKDLYYSVAKNMLKDNADITVNKLSTALCVAAYIGDLDMVKVALVLHKSEEKDKNKRIQVIINAVDIASKDDIVIHLAESSLDEPLDTKILLERNKKSIFLNDKKDKAPAETGCLIS